LSLDILKDVKLTAQIKLLPDRSQAEALLSTLRAANDACNLVSRVAWQGKTFRRFDLHHLYYRDVRARFNLSAQAAVRAISKVADSYKLDRKTERKFKSTGSIAYDDRIMSWRIPESRVSDKRNRKSQRLFSCVSCGFAGLADHIAADNIRRAAVNQPIVACVDAKAATLRAELRRSAATSPVL